MNSLHANNMAAIAKIKADLEEASRLLKFIPMSTFVPTPVVRSYDELHEEAYIAACELQSPNSADFEELWESTFERMCEEAGL